MQARQVFAFIVIVVLSLTFTGCRFHSEADPVVVEGGHPIFFVKRPAGNLSSPVDPTEFSSGSDLYMLHISSPGTQPANITGVLTKGKGAVLDPEPSFNGRKIVFSMRCSSESSLECSADTTWNIWTYDLDTASLAPVIQDYTIRNLGDDTDPVFVPGGKIVFSSTRQQSTRDRYGYVYVDEFQRGPASVLHVMDADGSNIQQISFNQSHDLNPSVMANGKILFSRWDHVGDRDHIAIYSANPDGTDLDVYYGAHSAGDVFLHPRELRDRRLISTALPLQNSWEGGALLTIDAQNYSDDNSPAPWVDVKKNPTGGQKPATLHTIPLGNELSRGGRFSAPYPVLDGTDDVLVSYSLFKNATEPTEPGGHDVVVQNKEAPPEYGIYMFNTADKSLRPIALPEPGFVYTDPVSASPRVEPPIINPVSAAQPGVFAADVAEGIINVKSVYDTDRFGRMGSGVMTPAEKSVMPIPQVKPATGKPDNREWVADIARLKDPAQTTASQRPARFLRVVKAQPSPPGLSQAAIGETDFGMRELVGYAPIEPDGSVKVKVPADVPIAITVLDNDGRAFENHTSWIQVRPGETLTCNGCHSSDRAEPLNSFPIAGNHPNTVLRSALGFSLGGGPQDGETMAETRTRLDPAALELSQDIEYVDVWTDSFVRPADASISMRYAELTTPTPNNGIINFPDHILPLFEKSRPNGGDQRCAFCHNGIVDAIDNPSGLNLTDGSGGLSGRAAAYDALTVGGLVFDDQGKIVYEEVDEVLYVRRELPLVKPGYARGSYLVEKLFNEELHAERGLPERGLDHSNMMTPAEKRLLVEWIDLGAQYYNSPIDNDGNLRSVSSRLDPDPFYNQYIHRFREECGICHMVAINGVPNSRFQPSRFVLTGEREGDFLGVTSMVTDIDNPASSLLLSVPSTSARHPLNQSDQPFLPQNGGFYQDLLEWIAAATSTPQSVNFAVPYSRVQP